MNRILLIISVLGMFLVPGTSVAQPQLVDPALQFSCPDGINVGEGVRSSQICPKYEKTKSCAGEQDVPLKITITGQAGLTLLGVSLAEEPSGDQPVPVAFRPIGRPTTRTTFPAEIEFSYTMNIRREAKARTYQVRLDLRYPNDKAFIEYFFLRLCSDGGIKVSDDSPKMIKGFTGDSTPFVLKLSNAFEQYPINLREIRIRSNPANLIEPAQQLKQYSPYESVRLHDKPFDLTVRLAGMSAKQLFYGFDDDSKIILDFVYDDGEAELVDYKEIKLNERASVTVLMIAILLGVLAGSLVKLYMQSLPKKQVSRKERLWFIVGTAAVGIVLSLVALFGEVQVVAFKLQGSYDNPKLLFIASLGVTIIGLPLFDILFRVSKSRGSVPEDKARQQNKEEM